MNINSETQRAIEDIRMDINQLGSKVNKLVFRGVLMIVAVVCVLLLGHSLVNATVPNFSYVLAPLICGAIFYYAIKASMDQVYSGYHDLVKRLNTEPVSVEDFTERAELFVDWDQPEAALLDYEQALKLEPNRENTLYFYALLLHFRKRDGEALELLERLETIHGEFYQSALLLKGDIFQTHNPEIALECYRELIAFSPDFLDVYLHQGRFLLELDRLEDAEDSLEHVRELLRKEGETENSLDSVENPNSYEFFYLQALLLFKRNRFQEAFEKLDFIADWEEFHDEDYHKLRADLYDKLGNPDAAEAERYKAQAWKEA